MLVGQAYQEASRSHEGSVITDLTETENEDMNLIKLANGEVQWLSLLDTAKNVLIP
jgi:hypothetical protein